MPEETRDQLSVLPLPVRSNKASTKKKNNNNNNNNNNKKKTGAIELSNYI